MKQVAQNYRSGELVVLDTPPPRCRAGGVLVRTRFSLISTGTELMKLSESKMSLIGKAKARPDQVAKVIEAATQQGPVSAYRKAMNRLDSYTPLGYSLAGIVVDVGAGVDEFKVGQLVACAGNEFALHAELNWVPRNLCVAVPDGVGPEAAAFATVGAIAMQGVRQAEVALGDTACVIGLGLVGQLVVQLLVAAGARVVGLDTVGSRCALAEKSGALLAVPPDSEGLAAVEQKLQQVSSGLGADRVFLVAGASSNAPVEAAARLARDRATIVDIGKCKLDLPWNSYYLKELDVRFSRSYGPGRYDPQYEEAGHDYPAGYVRWTERRNLQCFLDLIESRDVDPQLLISGTFPLGDAASVYERLADGALDGVGFLFEYPASGVPHQAQVLPTRETPAQVRAAASGRGVSKALRLGFVGAGNYACSMLIPHLANRGDVELAHVVTNRSLSAANAQRKFRFSAASTDVEDVLSDDSIAAVFVVTRHSSHADLVCRALEANKAVFVEKPLALTLQEVDRIVQTVESTGNDRLMVGFNRRFSPMLVQMKSWFGEAEGGLTARYLVNAGQLGKASWYRNEEMEGPRFVGEGGHFIDTVAWWIGADPTEVSALRGPAPGDVHMTLRFGQGSLASITYLASGHVRFPKETLDICGQGRSARLDNFKKGVVWSGRRRRVQRPLRGPDKGQRGALDAFLAAVGSGGPMPIPVNSLIATTKATLAVATCLESGSFQRL